MKNSWTKEVIDTMLKDFAEDKNSSNEWREGCKWAFLQVKRLLLIEEISESKNENIIS